MLCHISGSTHKKNELLNLLKTAENSPITCEEVKRLFYYSWHWNINEQFEILKLIVEKCIPLCAEYSENSSFSAKKIIEFLTYDSGVMSNFIIRDSFSKDKLNVLNVLNVIATILENMSYEDGKYFIKNVSCEWLNKIQDELLSFAQKEGEMTFGKAATVLLLEDRNEAPASEEVLKKLMSEESGKKTDILGKLKKYWDENNQIMRNNLKKVVAKESNRKICEELMKYGIDVFSLVVYDADSDSDEEEIEEEQIEAEGKTEDELKELIDNGTLKSYEIIGEDWVFYDAEDNLYYCPDGLTEDFKKRVKEKLTEIK